MNLFGDQSGRCRHCGAFWEVDGWEYCPRCHRNYGGAVYPAQQTEQELRDVEELVAKVHRAFADVTLGDNETLHQADLEGAYSDIQVWHDAKKQDPESHWTEVPDWKIESRFSTLSFFTPESWRFYIPAYLCWSLKNWRGTDSITVDRVLWSLADVDDRTMKRYELLNREQSATIDECLAFFDRYSGEPDAREAIEGYWHQFAAR